MQYDGYNNLSFDAENCLTSISNSVNAATYTCDAGGIRVKKAIQGGTNTAYVFAGQTDIAEYDYTTGNPSPSSPSREYIYADGFLTATIQGSTIIYHHSDQLSVRVTSDVNGNKIGEQGHYPYGEAWYTANTTTKFIFSSYERDAESGNDYAMARYYINRFARFCSADPLMGNPGDPQSWNRYAYVRNDPINAVDPSGQSVLSWLAKVFELIPEILFGLPHGPGLGGTPPIIDNGPLSDTVALLNSLYHPIDPSRFGIDNWSPGAHDQIYWNALYPCGVSKAIIWKIQNESRKLDKDWGTQLGETAYIHGMYGGYDTPAAATAKGNDWINSNISVAKMSWDEGHFGDAMTFLAWGLHTMSDRTSPAHTTNGQPNLWCDPLGCVGGFGKVLQHSPNEFMGIETRAALDANP